MDEIDSEWSFEEDEQCEDEECDECGEPRWSYRCPYCQVRLCDHCFDVHCEDCLEELCRQDALSQEIDGVVSEGFPPDEDT